MVSSAGPRRWQVWPEGKSQSISLEKIAASVSSGDLDGVKSGLREFAANASPLTAWSAVPVVLLDGDAKRKSLAIDTVIWLAEELETTALPGLVFLARELARFLSDAELRAELAYRGDQAKATLARFESLTKALGPATKKLLASSGCDYALHALVTSNPPAATRYPAALEGMRRFPFETEYTRHAIFSAVSLGKNAEAIEHFGAASPSLFTFADSGALLEPNLLAMLAFAYAAAYRAKEGVTALGPVLARMDWSKQSDKRVATQVAGLLAGAGEHASAITLLERAVALGATWAEIEDRAGYPAIQKEPAYQALRARA